MTTQRRKGFKAITVFLAFAMVQVCIQLGFAEATSSATVAAVPQQFIARLTTTGGPITVNGASAASGASLLTGATIETPAGVSATIDLGALGSVELPPGSQVQLDFADDGNVRVKVIRGCVNVRKSGPGEAEVYTAEGSSEKTNSNRRAMGFCYVNGALNPQGSASAAAAAGGGGGGGGLGGGVVAAIVVSVVAVPVVIWAATRGRGGNPSPSGL